MPLRHKLGTFGALALALVPLPVFRVAAADALAWPPATAQNRPWVWWWWHGSAVEETNLALELQRFQAGGLGGVQITTIYGVKGAEVREIPYLSPHWLALLGYTVDQAHRLGLGVNMSLGSGWCFGGPTVSDQDANASVVVKTYRLGVGERLREKFDRKLIQALVAFAPDGKSIDLTDSITTNAEVFFSPPGNWIGLNTTPPKTWTVYAISQKPSGQKVKRPAPGGEGWMLNPAYPQALHDWLPWFDQAFAHYTGPKPEAVFQDSYEYRTDWSPDFFAQFEKRRGYKLQTELPTLFAGNSQSNGPAAPQRREGGSTPQHTTDSDHVARVKYDYRRTLSEIMAEQSEPAWINWAHQNGFRTIYQAHGTPGNWLDLYGGADIPETEMFHHDRSLLISKFASSAAHTQGHQLIGAETGTWLKEHFTETLADLKYLADDMFLAGVNHIYYHGACYSPEDAPWPGWLFYASSEMNPRNPIWKDVPALNAYITRCQSVLQSGQPDNDVLLYWPVADFWSDPSGLVQPMGVSQPKWFEGQPIGQTAHYLWDHGYAFDYVSDAQLLQAKVTGFREIQLPGGKYGLVVVPPCKRIPLQTFKQLLALAESGATVIFQQELPLDIAGWQDLKHQQQEFAELRRKLKSHGKASRWSRLGKGMVQVSSLDEDLAAPREPMTEAGLSFVRRSLDEEGWNYFIANRSGTNVNGWITLGCAAQSVVMFDPMTGVAGVAALKQNTGGRPPRLHLQLAAGESIILRAFQSKPVQGPAWDYWQTNGHPFEITGNWNVKFTGGGPMLPTEIQTAKLASWTRFPDTNAQAFAGTAKYEITFDAPRLESSLSAATGTLKRELPPFQLDLGDVRQSARVRVNGRDYGTLIAPPFRLVVDHLQPAGNVLEVEVTSVAANRIRDLDRRGVNWKIFKDINLVNVDYQPFDASRWPLTDCGLLGPVTLSPVTAE